MKKYLIAGALIAGLATPALAAQYYVAQDSSSHKCSVTSKKPDGTKQIMLGSDSFKTKSEAHKALGGFSECKA